MNIQQCNWEKIVMSKTGTTDYDKGLSYLCSIGNYMETKENLLKKLKQGGVQDPVNVLQKLLEAGEITPAKKKDNYILKFKECRGGEQDIISE
jgi:hypothetical protein